MKNPCGRDCPKRTAICKITCPDWAEYEAWYMEMDKEKQKIVAAKSDYYAYHNERIESTKCK